jgi:catechol 2,3-dioxygenase-like lactoylglutathione lyase family enzyme
MKRLHVHVAVDDLAQSIGFYATLFGSEPSVRKHDYAKWMLDDPRVNFAISRRDRAAGLDHLGIQVDDDAELTEIAGRLARAGQPVHEQKATTCCYARSDKAWVNDPQGIAWETFRTFGDSTAYGEDLAVPEVCCPEDSCGTPASAEKAAAGACCSKAA